MPEIDVVGPLLVILVMSYSVFVLLSFFYRERVSRKKIGALYVLYFACLAYLLFFKNIGIRGFGLNPVETLRDIQAGSVFVPLMNVLLFVPLGTLLTSKKHFAFSCLGVIGVELLQYTCSLGICDTGDMLLNIAGLALGIAVVRLGLLNFFLQKID
ncbi:VanZ family protein [Streptococcus cuniculi]|nr:VanZ family protein [Streptococcus cuniculi]MBF0777304.1 VanZ family protein [Streptococcus cuniculi]